MHRPAGKYSCCRFTRRSGGGIISISAMEKKDVSHGEERCQRRRFLRRNMLGSPGGNAPESRSAISRQNSAWLTIQVIAAGIIALALRSVRRKRAAMAALNRGGS